MGAPASRSAARRSEVARTPTVLEGSRAAARPATQTLPSSQPPSTSVAQCTLKDRLSSFKVPRHLVVVDETDVPMTPSMKVRKPGLREIVERSLAE